MKKIVLYSRPNNWLSPLRYPGGKAKFSPLIASAIECNNLNNGHYLELYAGGAAVSLYLLFNNYVDHVYINDSDPAIYDFWVCVTQKTDELLKLINDTPVNMDEWFYWHSILRGEREASQLERGFSTFFMNRTNRSGILKGGVIGGKKQVGSYTLDARFNKDKLKKRIIDIAEKSDRITVYCEDALNLLKTFSKRNLKKLLIYLDPPYYIKGQGLYRNYYEHDDHVAIASALQNKNSKLNWIVSYDNVAQIKEMYKYSKNFQYNLSYTAQVKYVGSEVMFFSESLNIPAEFFDDSLSVA